MGLVMNKFSVLWFLLISLCRKGWRRREKREIHEFFIWSDLNKHLISGAFVTQFLFSTWRRDGKRRTGQNYAIILQYRFIIPGAWRNNKSNVTIRNNFDIHLMHQWPRARLRSCVWSGNWVIAELWGSWGRRSHLESCGINKVMAPDVNYKSAWLFGFVESGLRWWSACNGFIGSIALGLGSTELRKSFSSGNWNFMNLIKWRMLGGVVCRFGHIWWRSSAPPQATSNWKTSSIGLVLSCKNYAETIAITIHDITELLTRVLKASAITIHDVIQSFSNAEYCVTSQQTEY